MTFEKISDINFNRSYFVKSRANHISEEMTELEKKIKVFIRNQGVKLVGLAGLERLNGPPSLDLDYILPGGKSIVSFAMPMDVEAIYTFLSKKSPAPHNLDQLVTYQKIQRISNNLAEYLKSLGYRAKAVPPSADYRRSLYVFSTKPSFSHRFGAIASGIAGQGWSGNIITKEYGAAVYLSTVVTSAELRSDPQLPPEYFIDNNCAKCKRCAGACPSGMFSANEKEYILLNDRLYPRGKRINIDLCNISCFGLHSLSRDKKWTNWGLHWIDKWIKKPPDSARRLKMISDLLGKGLTIGDSAPRFFVLKEFTGKLWPEKLIENAPSPGEIPEDDFSQYSVLSEMMKKTGITGIENYPMPVVCGHCAIICGPTISETASRFKALINSGLVVPGPDGKMTRVTSFSEAEQIRRQYPLRASTTDILKDAFTSLFLWHRYYFGFQPLTPRHRASQVQAGLIWFWRPYQPLR